MAEHALERFPLHLGLGARASAEPEFTGMNWYSLYAERHAADGAEGRLVSIYTFGKSWTSWQMHSNGDEVVICTARGRVTVCKRTQTIENRNRRNARVRRSSL